MRSVGDILCVRRRCDQFAIYRRFPDIAQMCERHTSIIRMSIKWTIDIRLIHLLRYTFLPRKRHFMRHRYSRSARHKYLINDIVWVNVSLSIFQCSNTKAICEWIVNCDQSVRVIKLFVEFLLTTLTVNTVWKFPKNYYIYPPYSTL